MSTSSRDLQQERAWELVNSSVLLEEQEKYAVLTLLNDLATDEYIAHVIDVLKDEKQFVEDALQKLSPEDRKEISLRVLSELRDYEQQEVSEQTQSALQGILSSFTNQ